MGLLQRFFGGSSKPKVIDMVWLSEAAKWRGLAAQALQVSAQRPVIVTAHFPATLAGAREALQGQQVSAWKELPTAGMGMAIELASDLHPLPQAASHPAQRCPMTVIAAERYPLAERDLKLAGFVASLPEGSEFYYHISFDDLLLREFVGEATLKVLRMMGMNENAPIQDGRITDGILRAQKRWSTKVTVDNACNSPQEWLERHRAVLQ